MRIDDLLACDACGAPATHADRLAKEHACEACAQTTAARREGAVLAAMDLLGFVAEQLRDGGLEDDQIRAAVDAVLTAPHSRGGGYPIADAPRPRSGFEPLGVSVA